MGQSGQKTIAGQVQKARLISKYIPAVSKGQSCSEEVKAGVVAHVPSSDKLPGEQSHLLFWKPGVRSERKAARATACTRTFKPLSLSGGSSLAHWDVPVLVFLYLFCHSAPASLFDG